MKKLIPVSRVRPGQEFLYYGQAYRRATDEEAERHPGQEMAARRNRELVFCYQGEDRNQMAVSFAPINSEGDTRVVVEARKKRGKKR